MRDFDGVGFEWFEYQGDGWMAWAVSPLLTVMQREMHRGHQHFQVVSMATFVPLFEVHDIDIEHALALTDERPVVIVRPPELPAGILIDGIHRLYRQHVQGKTEVVCFVVPSDVERQVRLTREEALHLTLNPDAVPARFIRRLS